MSSVHKVGQSVPRVGLRRAKQCIGLLAGLLSWTAPAYGQQCTVLAPALNFGMYDGFTVDRTSFITVACNERVGYDVSLDGGISGSPLNRSMVDGGNELRYQLYQNSGRTTVWGDGVNGDVLRVGSGNSRIKLHRVYGRVPGAQPMRAGDYTDTVTITIELR